jgi:hypothetical protein
MIENSDFVGFVYRTLLPNRQNLMQRIIYLCVESEDKSNSLICAAEVYHPY